MTLRRRLLLLRKLPGRRFRRVDKRSAIHRLLFSAAGAGWIFQEDEWVDGATLIHPCMMFSPLLQLVMTVLVWVALAALRKERVARLEEGR